AADAIPAIVSVRLGGMVARPMPAGGCRYLTRATYRGTPANTTFWSTVRTRIPLSENRTSGRRATFSITNVNGASDRTKKAGRAATSPRPQKSAARGRTSRYTDAASPAVASVPRVHIAVDSFDIRRRASKNTRPAAATGSRYITVSNTPTMPTPPGVPQRFAEYDPSPA